MTWVKVCGLTRPRDVEAAVAAGADAVGFVVDPRSRRSVEIDEARTLMADVAAARFLVSADADPDALLAAAIRSGADGIQPHGRHAGRSAALAAQAGLRILRPVVVGPAGPAEDIAEVPPSEIVLFDTAGGSSAGGTGVAFDWDLVGHVERSFVLAGGLGPDNVGEAIRAVHPWGVDASSGLETAPGVKDAGKVVAFVTEAKRTWS